MWSICCCCFFVPDDATSAFTPFSLISLRSGSFAWPTMPVENMLNSFPYRRPLPTCVHTVRLSLFALCACMCVCVCVCFCVCVQGNLTRSLKVSQQNQRRMAKAADDRKRRVCSASKSFHLTSIGWLAPGKIKPRSHPTTHSTTRTPRPPTTGGGAAGGVGESANYQH